MDAAPNDSPLTCGAFVTFRAVRPIEIIGFFSRRNLSTNKQLIGLRHSIA
jgi:hypothetical protein